MSDIDTSNMTVEQMQALSRDLKEKLKNETRNVSSRVTEAEDNLTVQKGMLVLIVDTEAVGRENLMNKKGTHYVIGSSLGFKNPPGHPEITYSVTVMRKKE